MLFDDANIDITFLNLAGLKDDSCMSDILPAKEGFLKGNMFKNEYEPYKNYKYANLVPKTEKEARLFNVMQYSFAINDLNLYLDLHPDDQKVFQLFKRYIEEERKAKEEYERNYGPLVLNANNIARYEWISEWPWEKRGGSQYV